MYNILSYIQTMASCSSYWLLFPLPVAKYAWKCVLAINPEKSNKSEDKGGRSPLEADGWHQERPWRARGVFCLTICGFSTKSQPEHLLVSSNKPTLTLPTTWMVSAIYFTPFGLTILPDLTTTDYQTHKKTRLPRTLEKRIYTLTDCV